MALRVKQFQRLERWNALADRFTITGLANGTRQSVWPRRAIQSLTARSAIDGQDQLTAVLDATDPGTIALTRGQILRVQDPDGTSFDEWEVIDITADVIAGTVTVTATGVLAWLGQCFPFYFSAGLGTPTRLTHTYENLLLADVLGNICSICGIFGRPFVGGTAPVVRVSLVVTWESCLSALARLCAQLGYELDYRTGYAIDIVTARGAGVPRLDLRYGKNLETLQLKISTAQLATRLIPHGADGSAEAATLSGALWKVTAIAIVGPNATLTLADPAGGPGPIAVDNQFVGYMLTTPYGATFSNLTASNAAAQTITYVGGFGGAVGDLVRLSGPGTGIGFIADLPWVDHPAAIALYGIQAALLDARDVVSEPNWVLNPAMRIWTGGAGGPPDHWAVVAGATLTKELGFVQNSPQSTKVVGVADGDGIITAAVAPLVSDGNRYVSGFARILVTAGTARVELVFTTPLGTVVMPAGAPLATSSMQNQWLDLGLQGYDTYWAKAATAVQVRVVQHGATAMTAYVQAAQFTVTAAQTAFIETGGPNVLWQRANAELLKRAVPAIETTVAFVDLARLTGGVIDVTTSQPQDRVFVGQPVRVTHPRLVAPVDARVIAVTWDYLTPAATQVEIASTPARTSQLLANPKPLNRARGVPAPTVGLLSPV